MCDHSLWRLVTQKLEEQEKSYEEDTGLEWTESLDEFKVYLHLLSQSCAVL